MQVQGSKEDVRPPRVVHQTPGLRLWHKPDAATYELPAAAVYLAFHCPEVAAPRRLGPQPPALQPGMVRRSDELRIITSVAG